MKNSVKKAVILLLVLSLIVSVSFIVTACDKDNPAPTPKPAFLKAEDSADGYATVYKPEDRDIKIMLFSDPQVDTTQKYNIVGSLGTDKTYAFLADMVKSTSPDLVIINGDMVMTTLPANASYFIRYCEMFESLGVAWMPVFGNHDSEKGWPIAEDTEAQFGQYRKDLLVDLLASYEHCLINSDPACEDGYGNYFVNVRGSNDELIYTLCAFDCVHNPDFASDGESYLYTPTAKQVNWYKDTINKLSDAEYGKDRTSAQVVKSMIFNHVGIPEFNAAWKAAWNNGTPTEDYYYGRWFDGNYTNKYGDKPESEQIFSVAKALGSTTAIFMCHHHDNDFSVNYEGIRLTFGQHSGVSHNYRTEHSANGVVVGNWKDVDFSRIDDYGNQRGGTEITISSKDSYDVTPVYAQEVLDNFVSDYYIDYDAVAATLEADEDYSTGVVIRGTDRKWKITANAAALAA